MKSWLEELSQKAVGEGGERRGGSNIVYRLPPTGRRSYRWRAGGAMRDAAGGSTGTGLRLTLRDQKSQKRIVYWNFMANRESCLLKS